MSIVSFYHIDLESKIFNGIKIVIVFLSETKSGILKEKCFQL